MTARVPRTCTEIRDDRHTGASERPVGDSIDWRGLLGGHESAVGPDASHTLDDYRESDAYVLLGAPGAGKTTEFRHEAAHAGGHYVTARDFLTFDDRPEWRGTTLYIDGLDEMRAGSPDGRTPLDGIRRRLDALGRPRFRLSCRDADWFGDSDRVHLEAVSGDGRVTVLRLDPLPDDGIRALLDHHAGVEDVAEFIAGAQESGIGSLLENPQSLKMLADAVAGGAWPATRTETFELACEKLVRETSSGHRIANPDGPPTSELLDAAGRVCALQLICGLEGAALTEAAADDDFPAPERFSADAVALRRVLPSRIFERAEHGQRVPIHRNVAEFLAARHLAGLVSERNLPVRRVLALLTGEDGGVVTPLRGLAAWLAACSGEARRELIERDPEGTGVYGDTSAFTPEEKRRLLEGLRSPDDSLPAHRFTSLATPDMAPILRGVLAGEDRGDGSRALIEFLLCVLATATPLPELREVLLDLATDDGQPPRAREWASLCLAEGALARPDEFGDVVHRLLSDLRDVTVPDNDRSLMGLLLQSLYPTFVKPDEVFGFLGDGRTDKYLVSPSPEFGRFEHFWRYDLPRETPAGDVSVVLDELADIFERSEEWWLTGESPIRTPVRSVAALVTRALKCDEEWSSRRAVRWLRLVGADDGADPERSQAVRDWIEARPERYKELLRESVARCLEAPTPGYRFLKAKALLHGVEVPSDYGIWCLGEIERADGGRELAGFWFEEAWNALVNGHGAAGLALEQLESVAAGDADLEKAFDELRTCDVFGRDAETQRRLRQRDLERRRKQEQELADWRRAFLQHEKALRENRCPTGVLHTIAEVYRGHYRDFQAETGRARLRQLLGMDTLVEAAMVGLRGAIHRNDLPAPTYVLALRKDDQRHVLALPVLAGLELSRSSELLQLDPDQARMAMAFFLAERRSFPGPDWLRSLVEAHANVAADEIVRFATMEMRRGERHIPFVHALSVCEWVRDTARAVCPRLLSAFPVRAPRHMCDVLDRLLWWGIGDLETSLMDSIVNGKLSSKSMTVTQRAHWLGAQLVASAQPDLEAVESFARGHGNAMTGFLAFFEHGEIRTLLLDRLSSQSLGRLVRLLGPGHRPMSRMGVGSAKFRESDFVRTLMEALGSRTDNDAVFALTDLASAPEVAAWHATARRVQREQRILRRNARYRHPDIDAARLSLECRQPANAADLVAVTLDALAEVSANIRHGATNDWRQYWNPNGSERQGRPKDENDCRDALLSDLRYKLGPLGIDAAPEGRYADEKRADIRVSYGGFNVPVEIKKSNHRDLWSAVRHQLIARYSRDPDADGSGIYLVLWFGGEYCQLPESGVRPRDASELEERLRGTLAPEEARLISICVIDVERP